jgi:non-ribosomal peptide synthetase component F
MLREVLHVRVDEQIGVDEDRWNRVVARLGRLEAGEVAAALAAENDPCLRELQYHPADARAMKWGKQMTTISVHAARSPQRPAVIYGNGERVETYAELELRSRQIAHLLRG